MRTTLILLTCLLLGVSPVVAQDLAAVDIPYEKRVLDNGLTVLVHEDDSAPTAFVVVYYKVGSRDEVQGKTGFAHLFEHLMFNGTENYDGEYSLPISEVGGWMNGDTYFDRTRYYQGVPNTALDRVLWLESERMGHFLGVLTQEKLDREIGVVQNEKRQGDNRPYATSSYRMLENLFGIGHPYSWDTIGSLDDLRAASLDDVHAWFKKYYGAKNAIIAIAGDVDAEEVIASVERHFGDIPGGEPVNRLDDFVPTRTSITSDVMQDRVPNPQLQRAWVAPGRDHRESSALQYATIILGGDESSRLYKALVKESGLATSVRFRTNPQDLASMGQLTVTLAKGADFKEANAVIDSVLAEFRENGPSQKELDLTKTALSSRVVQGLANTSGKGIRLAEGEFYASDPDFYKTEFNWLETATADEVRDVARNWLGENYHQIRIEQYDEPKVIASDVDRSGVPDVAEFPAATAPGVEDFALKNGVKVRFVERKGVPAVSVSAAFDFGRTAEFGDKVGVFEMTLEMLDKGAGRRDANEILDGLKETGSRFSTSGDNDQSVFSLATLTSKADAAVALFSEILRAPTFDDKEFDLARGQKLEHIESDKQGPGSIIERYQGMLLYGDDHPYGMIQHGDVDVIEELSTDDLRAFHKKWFRPENLTLYVGGDISQDELKKVLERHFGDWKADGPAGVKASVGSQPERNPSRVVLFDMPGAVQSQIVAVQQISPSHGEGHETFELANKIFGATFTSRLNGNLRVDKGWTYGARSGASNDRGPQAWKISTPVQTDKTSESIVEILSELDAVQGDKPFTAEEFTAVQNEAIRGLPMSLDSTSAALGYLINALKFGLPDDDIELRSSRYEQVSVELMVEAFGNEIDRESLIWIIAGDLAKVEEGIRALDLGPVEVWDADGNVIR